MEKIPLSHFLKIATEAAHKGGTILEKYWGKLTKIEQKGAAWDLVTEADKESEALIISHIQKEFPTHTLLAEESGLTSAPGAEYVWVIDPLDGTTNYTHTYPMVSISIGLLHQGKPIMGVVYNPIHHELFQATRGNGATLNNQKLLVSKVKSLSQSLLATGFAYDRKDNEDNNYQEFCHITQISQGVRRGGSAALDLAYVAAGRLDGYWERGLKPWDIAAGILLIEEAGGRVTSYESTPLDLETGRILATNSLVHSELSKELHRSRAENIRLF